ncbi:hypothetical protein BDZ89DRAFT_205110 [Hymenopellis radicata]|nr:hypothetical protein BDZ89DRAFT_205110 [Hymenopellis radicata]
MHPKLPQEILIFIIDDVAKISCNHHETLPPLMALLRASSRFSRCRQHIYRRITLCLESPLLNTEEKTLDKRSLRFLELLRDLPEIRDFVKEVYISPRFMQASTMFVITETPAWRLLAEINGYLPNVESVDLSFHLYPEMDEPMTFDEELAEALPMILPSCPFRKLTIENVSIQPTYLMAFLAHFPQITSLDISEATLCVWAGPEPQHTMIKDTHPKINELILSEANFVFQICWQNNAFRTVIAPSTVRRLVLPFLDTNWIGIGVMDHVGTVHSQIDVFEGILPRDFPYV